ncbi:MAG: hypothetical protein KGN78_13640 [Actinomycetales bacterium]|nr:hypothetical protein [Actinomycetales bacterium]
MIEREQCLAGVTQAQAALIDVSVYNRIICQAQRRWELARRRGDLVGAAKAAQDSFLYALLWSSGMRCGDALKLNANQLNMFRSSEASGVYIAAGIVKNARDLRITVFDRRPGEPELPKGERRYTLRSNLKLYIAALHELGLELT